MISAGRDPHVILDEALHLVEKKEYADALQRFLWLYEHGDKHLPDFYRVRLSFVVGYWAQLGRIYKPALDAITSIRAQLVRKFHSQPEVPFKLFQEIFALDEALGNRKETISLFISAAEKSCHFAASAMPLMEDILVEQREYQVFKRFGGSLLRMFDYQCENFRRETALFQSDEIGTRKDLWTLMIENYKCRFDGLVCAALEMGEIDLAEQFRSRGAALFAKNPPDPSSS